MMKEAEIRKARQSMGMIFQQFNLLAQRNVLQNVCFPMEIAGVPKAEAKKRAAELLKLVGLEERMKAYPAQLSGGQKQRVAIARAMSTNPKVLACAMRRPVPLTRIRQNPFWSFSRRLTANSVLR